jgi:hypothetical protein
MDAALPELGRKAKSFITIFATYLMFFADAK